MHKDILQIVSKKWHIYIYDYLTKEIPLKIMPQSPLPTGINYLLSLHITDKLSVTVRECIHF